MHPYKIHHRKIHLTSVLENTNTVIFRDEEDQGYYLQAIVPFTIYEAYAVFRKDLPSSSSDGPKASITGSNSD
jgi:hypothetical protein